MPTATDTTAYADLRAYLDNPPARRHDPCAMRLAAGERCECKRWEHIAGKCVNCHGTGYADAPSPDNPLAGLSPSVADEAVYIACVMCGRMKAAAHWLQHIGRAPIAEGPFRWEPTELRKRYDASHTLRLQYIRDCMAQPWRIDLPTWWARVRAVLAIRNPATAELEA